MIADFQNIYSLLTPSEQKRIYPIFFVILLMGMWEVVGISSIVPFLSVASNPEMIQTNTYLRWGYQICGFTSTKAYLIALGILSIIVLVGSQAFNALTYYLILDFTTMRQYSLSVRLLHKYLHQPYPYFLNHNSAGMHKVILSEVQQVVKGVLIPMTDLLAKLVTCVCITGFLFIVDPVLAGMVALTLGGSYSLVFLFVRRKLVQIGEERLQANGLRFKIAAEAFGGIKDVKLLGKENVFVRLFREPARRFSKYLVYSSLIASLPSYAISMIAFSGILLITIYLITVKEDFQQALPVIAIYAFSGYRLLPAIRTVYSEMTQVRFNLPAARALYRDLQGHPVEVESIPADDEGMRLPFMHTVELRQITFAYPNAAAPIFQHLTLLLTANTSIGIVGATGCGKTTLVDIILGLLHPQRGQLIVDGVTVQEQQLRQWQRNVGYVPQQIFLSDDTITRNIAFGIPDDLIDISAVERAAHMANLHDFLTTELPHGYNTLVGERGIRLSGGQRQRIGIARALYYDPAFLIFDEATSALDNLTEIAVMDAIHTLAGKKTLILIAHRLTTVKECDRIYLMDKGQIIAEGDYETLLRTSVEFQRMVNA